MTRVGYAGLTIVVVIALLLALSAQAPAVQAQTTVTEQVTITVSPHGASSQIVNIGSGCGFINSTLSADGYTHIYTGVTANCYTSFTAPAATSSNRWVFTNSSTASTSWTYRTAASGTDTQSNMLYYQDIITASYSGTVASGGAPSIKGTFLGTAGTSTALTTSPTTVYLDGGTPYVITKPSADFPGSTERYETNYANGTASGGATLDPVFYQQYELGLSYTVSGGQSPIAPTLTATQFGRAYTPTLTTSATTYWLDNGGPWSLTNPLSGSGSTERWDANSGTFGTVLGAFTEEITYYQQFLYALSYSISDSSTPAAPKLGSSQFGVQFASALTTAATDYWLDSGAVWSLTNPLSGSNSTMRWETPGSTSGTVSSPLISSFTYYHQFYIQFSYSISGGGSGYSAPVLTYSFSGVNVQATLVATGNQYWVDAGSSWSASGQLGGSSASERWSTQASTGTADSQAPIALPYFHQYLITMAYSLIGGGTGYTPPSLTFQSYGSPSSAAIGESPSSIWADAGSSWSSDNPLSGSTSQERWETNTTTASTVLSPLTLSLTYFHQYQVTLIYSILGGGTGYSTPNVQITQFGVPISAFSGWADVGSSYSYTNPLNGSSPSERWYTGSGDGTIQSSSEINATYYHQYDFVLSYKVFGSTAQPSPPDLNSTALGLRFSEQLRTTPSDYWLDSGSNWSVSTSLQGSGMTERWMTNQTTFGRMLSTNSDTFEYYQQYLGHFAYVVVNGGSPLPPYLTFVEFGSTQKSNLSAQPDSLWVDSNSNWLFPLLLSGSNGAERWIANDSMTGTMSGAFSITMPYLHQYYLHTDSNSVRGGATANATQWCNRGATVSLNATASTGWRFVYWEGTGSGAYNGTEGAPSFPLDGPANETAIYYPGLTISTGSAGFVMYSYGTEAGNVSAGSTLVIFVPPGSNVSLEATPTSFTTIFSGWSGVLSGGTEKSSIVMNAPAQVTASFQPDFADISVTVVVIPIVVVLAVYILAIRRWPQNTA